jgi:hypothetical protein
LFAAANALVASSRASPSSKLLEALWNFIKLLIFFPEKRREPVLGGLRFAFA